MKKTKKYRNGNKLKKQTKKGGGSQKDKCLAFVLAMLSMTGADQQKVRKIKHKNINSKNIKENIKNIKFNTNEFNNPYSKSRIRFHKNMNQCLPSHLPNFEFIPFISVAGPEL